MPEIAASVKESLAKRRVELSQSHTFDLDLPGYEHQGVVARYQPLDYKVMRSIGLRHEHIKNVADQELNVAGDVLTTSCRDLLIRDENGEVELSDGTKANSLGCRLNSAAARDLFGIELPDGVPARDALAQIVPDSSLIMAHFAHWVIAAEKAHSEVEEAVVGEPQAGSVQ